jgi:hypothetical protein
MYTIALRARWRGVTSSEVSINHLGKDRREFVDDGGLAVRGESPPDVWGVLFELLLLVHMAS